MLRRWIAPVPNKAPIVLAALAAVVAALFLGRAALSGFAPSAAERSPGAQLTLKPAHPPAAKAKRGSRAARPSISDLASLDKELRAASPTDLAAFERLEDQASRLIEQDPQRFEDQFVAWLGELNAPAEPDLRLGVFVMDLLADHGLLSARVLLSVLKLETDAEMEMTEEQAHHGGGPRQNIDLLQIHSLSLVRELDAAEQEGLALNADLRVQLVDLAENGANLAIVREAMLDLVTVWSDSATAEITRIAEQRPVQDRFAYEDLLNASAGN
jgi:hypothetical protein